jgi:antitoxin ParD1/3/4
VKTGPYTSASKVVLEALQLMEARDQMQAFCGEDIRRKIAAGVASLRAGEGEDGDAFLNRMDVELAELEGREPM